MIFEIIITNNDAVMITINQHQASIHVCVWKVGQFPTKTLICFPVVMPDGVGGIAILSLLTGAALNSMASGLVSDTNGGHQF